MLGRIRDNLTQNDQYIFVSAVSVVYIKKEKQCLKQIFNNSFPENIKREGKRQKRYVSCKFRKIRSFIYFSIVYPAE